MAPSLRAVRRSAASIVTLAAVVAGSLATGNALVAAQVDPSTTTTVPTDTTTTTAPPTTTPPAPTLQDLFPGIDPSITVEQLEAFFRWIQGPPVPANSGAGRRIVYSNSAQRVWLIEGDESVSKTYLVSGRTGMPRFGTYKVFSKSRYTTSGSARMEFMVRFARGRNLAIGFHTIPLRANGTPLQTAAELGYPRSHGCVRQNPPDAMFLYMWAPVGTTVVAVP
jgi:hypothetical protein